MTETESRPSLQELAQRKREAGRTVSIWVKGDTGRDPPRGRAASIRAANAIMPEDGTFVEPQKEGADVELNDGDTILFTLEPDHDYEALEPVRRVLRTARAMQINVIVHAKDIPKWTQRLCDVKITANDDGSTSVAQMVQQNFGQEVFERPLTGFTGGDDA